MLPAHGREAHPPHGPEWSVLEALCASFAERRPLDGAALERVADPAFRWGVFLEHAVTHKLHLLAAAWLLPGPAGAHVPKRLRTLLQEAWTVNRHRARLLAREAGRITRAARERGVTLAVRKGIAFEHQFYGALGARYFADIDFLALPADRQAVAGVLGELGYTAGDFDFASGAVIPFDRRQLAGYRMHPDHLPKMVLATGDPVVRWIDADVANSLTWAGSGLDVPLEPALAAGAALELGDGQVATVMPPAYQLLDDVLHLFREAYVQTPLREDNAVVLSAFLDVWLCWRWCREQGADPGALIRAAGVEGPAAWVLEHTDRLFGTDLRAQAGVRVDDEHVPLDGWRPVSGDHRGRWHGDFRRRLAAGGGIEPAPARPEPQPA